MQKVLQNCLFSQKENLDLAFKTGASVGISASLVRCFTQLSLLAYLENCLKLVCFCILYINCVTDSGGDAEGGRARLAEGPGLRRKHFPSL